MTAHLPPDTEIVWVYPPRSQGYLRVTGDLETARRFSSGFDDWEVGNVAYLSVSGAEAYLGHYRMRGMCSVSACARAVLSVKGEPMDQGDLFRAYFRLESSAS